MMKINIMEQIKDLDSIFSGFLWNEQAFLKFKFKMKTFAITKHFCIGTKRVIFTLVHHEYKVTYLFIAFLINTSVCMQFIKQLLKKRLKMPENFDDKFLD